MVGENVAAFAGPPARGDFQRVTWKKGRLKSSAWIGKDSAMREMPANQLNPRIKSVWRINDAIWIVVSFLCCFLPFAIIALVAPEEAWAGVVALIVAICVRGAACAVRGGAAAHSLCSLALRAYAGLPGHRSRHLLAQALRHSVHPRAEHRHAPRAHPARLRAVQRHRGNCRPASTRFPASASKRPTCCAIVPPSWRVWPERTYK